MEAPEGVAEEDEKSERDWRPSLGVENGVPEGPGFEERWGCCGWGCWE